MKVILETERLVLREFEGSDVTALLGVFGDAEVMRFGSGVQTRAWVETWLSDRLADYAGDSGIGVWAVTERATGAVMGYCGLFHFPDVAGAAETEIGYRLARRYWGRGYATEAAQGVLAYGFHGVGLQRLISIIDPSNVRSIRVAEKLGMRYEKDVMFAGYTHPDRVYAIARGK